MKKPKKGDQSQKKRMANHMSDLHVQLSLLVGAKLKGQSANDQSFESADFFLGGRYERVLESSEVAAQLFRIPAAESERIENYVKKNLENLLENPCENPEKRDLEVLIVGASCLLLFIQNNWLGPRTEKDPLSFCHAQFIDLQKEVLSDALEDLGVDGEEAYGKSRHVLYLYLARLIFLEGISFFTHLQTWDWWLMRCVTIHQHLLSQKSPTIRATVLEIIDNVVKKEPLMTECLFRDVQAMFHLEAGHACHDYFEYKQAADHFNTAKKLSGLNVSLSGAMGKRTQFQQEDKAQLVLKVTREEGQDDVDGMFEFLSGVPKVLPHGDDTVLEEVKYTDENATASPQLSPFEQSLVLGLMESYRRSVAQERLTVEEVQTYLAYLLHHSTNWSVVSAALHLRSKLEKDSRRRVERSMMQLEVLSKMATTAADLDEVSTRVPLFFSSHLSPSWTVRQDYAILLLSLGLFGEALDVFETLEMWENVISCYQRLKKLEKAESLIRERIAVKETPALLCFLGDVTSDIGHYQKAWDLSNHRNSRAMRCMGYLHFNRHEFDKANECFSKSLEINPLQIPLWFTHGCAAMACEHYEVAAKAFRRCVTIEYDNFEAWSNLATCFARLKEKKKAFSVLLDALKCNYENWKLWENSLVIGTDIGEFQHVINSYHRLIDLKKKWTDVEVLNILTRAVVEKLPDADGNPADRLHGKVMELFGRITSTVTGEGEIWSDYAKLSMMKVGDREPDGDKALQYLQKAHRCFSQKVGWEKDVEVCQKVATQTIHLAETHVQCADGKPDQEALRLLSSAKLTLRGTLAKIQKQHTDPVTQQLSSQVEEMCSKMDSTLQNLVSRIDSLK